MQLEKKELENIRTEILKMAAGMLTSSTFISPFKEDNPNNTSRGILKQAEEQQKLLRSWAIKLRQIYDALGKLENGHVKFEENQT